MKLRKNNLKRRCYGNRISSNLKYYYTLSELWATFYVCVPPTFRLYSEAFVLFILRLKIAILNSARGIAALYGVELRFLRFKYIYISPPPFTQSRCGKLYDFDVTTKFSWESKKVMWKILTWNCTSRQKCHYIISIWLERGWEVAVIFQYQFKNFSYHHYTVIAYHVKNVNMLFRYRWRRGGGSSCNLRIPIQKFQLRSLHRLPWDDSQTATVRDGAWVDEQETFWRLLPVLQIGGVTVSWFIFFFVKIH